MSNLSRRDLAFREYGDPQATKILLCIPGILESQRTFDGLIPFLIQHDDLRVITVDLCGRGHSDWLGQNQDYKMSLYLKDLTAVINHIHATHRRKIRNLYLLGTSMGGILAMHLSANKQLHVKGLILNDVALTVSWKSIYKLYSKLDSKSAKTKVGALSRSKNIDPKLLIDIQLPSHLDLDYRINLRGIHFHRLVSNFDGPMLLLRGEHSEICTLLDQIEFKQYAAQGHCLEVNDAAHPVSYSRKVLRAIADFLKLQKTSLNLCDFDSEIDYEDLGNFKKLTV